MQRGALKKRINDAVRSQARAERKKMSDKRLKELRVGVVLILPEIREHKSVTPAMQVMIDQLDRRKKTIDLHIMSINVPRKGMIAIDKAKNILKSSISTKMKMTLQDFLLCYPNFRIHSRPDSIEKKKNTKRQHRVDTRLTAFKHIVFLFKENGLSNEQMLSVLLDRQNTIDKKQIDVSKLVQRHYNFYTDDYSIEVGGVVVGSPNRFGRIEAEAFEKKLKKAIISVLKNRQTLTDN